MATFADDDQSLRLSRLWTICPLRRSDKEGTAMMKAEGLEPLYRSGNDLPWIPFTPYSETVTVKLLKVDPVTGQTVAMLRVPPGEGLGVHNHYGTVIAYTIRGKWRYAEHGWVSKAGDLVYETAGSQHTFLAEPGEAVEVFIVLEGALEFIDPEGRGIGLENWRTFLERYYKYCEAKGLPARDLSQFS
jgi:quercetin dioxygenase-like cupin family protein